MVEQMARRSADTFTVHTEYGDALAIVHPNGPLDDRHRDLLRESLDVLDRDVVVDLTGVTVLDPSAVRVLVAQRERLAGAGWTCRLVNPNCDVKSALTVAGMDDWLEY